MKTEPLLLRPRQAAEMLAIKERKFHDLKAQGKLPKPLKIGRCLVYRVADLKLWVELGMPNLERFEQLKKQG